MYCVNGNSSWYINCRPLFGGCPLLGVSVIGGSTVVLFITCLPSERINLSLIVMWNLLTNIEGTNRSCSLFDV